MGEKILFVDDNPDLLASFTRQLHKLYDIKTATSGEEGLRILSSAGPFAVVVSDMKMPTMNGIEFLSQAKKLFPDTVRIMLTGYADVQSAIEAVNEGNIFRFLTKPCSIDAINKALVAGIKQYQLVTSERELLDQTLKGSITTLTGILGLVNPIAFSRATRVKEYVQYIVKRLKLSDSWQYEIAATLSQIGFVAIPPDLLERLLSQERLTPAEQQLLSRHPKVGRKLLENIPRLREVALMIESQQKPYIEYEQQVAIAEMSPTDLGAQILKLVLDYDQLISSGLTPDDAQKKMSERRGEYNPQLLALLGSYQAVWTQWTRKQLRLSQLTVGMIFDEDVYTDKGVLLLKRGQEVTIAVLEKLDVFYLQRSIKDIFRMLVPG